MPTLAALNRKARRLTGKTMRDAKRAARAQAASQVVEAAARDERVKALTAYLAADSQAKAWADWSRDLFATRTAAALSNLDAFGALTGIPVIAEERDGLVAAMQTREARRLLLAAYNADAARSAALRRWAAAEAGTGEATDDTDPARAAALERRRAYIRAADEASTVARFFSNRREPSLSPIARGAVAMLMLLTDARMLAALPGSIQGVSLALLLPDACRAANLILPAKAQTTVETTLENKATVAANLPKPPQGAAPTVRKGGK